MLVSRKRDIFILFLIRTSLVHRFFRSYILSATQLEKAAKVDMLPNYTFMYNISARSSSCQSPEIGSAHDKL